ncbi:Hypothetical predicted protein [Xyrichtys novacula]|uniref:Uncharacterized protein n=1 Tax=Xyrichtys novacula TaxID=13765 RepID=A0AAV1HFF5_XYRNO|nr:Hypothetical predicted protein [Xyrichtys novacula]
MDTPKSPDGIRESLYCGNPQPRPVQFHTVLYNGHGRMDNKIPGATRSKDTQGTVDGRLAVGTNRARGEWQETDEEFRCGSGDGWLGQQDDEGGEEPIRPNGEASVVSSHKEGGFFIISSAPLVKSLLMSLQAE